MGAGHAKGLGRQAGRLHQGLQQIPVRGIVIDNKNRRIGHGLHTPSYGSRITCDFSSEAALGLR